MHATRTPFRLARHLRRAASTTLVLLATLACSPASAKLDEFPTSERFIWVQACLREHPGGFYEMVNKCACAFDQMATELSFEDYVEMSTASNANTIGGERGSYIRDTEKLQDEIRRYRAIQAKAKKSCYVTR
ncbi:hypothetical protein [Leptothrix discophora]|uniref:Uncharacterized protein n=1 Tax=Leptothrix discophora TaxID=89 RepID=A0ABT9G8F1_LEPDI|nr:hypothetical protein [Leptothrix discophora]MDP4302764.1 hypothetical protein [Leptothrix discophora]